jgi:hypothetical protein
MPTRESSHSPIDGPIRAVNRSQSPIVKEREGSNSPLDSPAKLVIESPEKETRSSGRQSVPAEQDSGIR